MENSAKIVEFAQNFQDFQLHKISSKNILLKITGKNSNFIPFSSKFDENLPFFQFYVAG
jgi:hypothetical protein